MKTSTTYSCFRTKALMFMSILTGLNSMTLAADIIAPDAKLERIAQGLKFTEGPAWLGTHLIFSDIPSDRLLRWTPDGKVTEFRKPSGGGNGNTLDRQGRLITCEGSNRRVTRTEPNGDVTVLCDKLDGKRFNSPNDVVVKSDGTIWFTDPTYGLGNGEKEMDGNYVYRFDPKTGETVAVGKDFDQPNGLCFSPDESLLYVADSGKPHHVRVYDVKDGSTLLSPRIFCTIDQGVPDGMRCDVAGRLYSSAQDGVQVFDTDGKLITRILVPETTANLCFGDADRKTLYLTATTSVYKIRVQTAGAIPTR